MAATTAGRIMQLSHNASIHGTKGVSALMLAAILGRTEVVVLVKTGANRDMQIEACSYVCQYICGT